MCPTPKISKQEPAAAPPPAANNATVNQAAAQTPEDIRPEETNLRAKRRGRNGLRIPLDATPGSRSTGLNIPQA